MRDNIHNIYFTHNKSNLVKIYQYDKGQILSFDDTFKNGTEVQFANGMTKPIFNKQVVIPDIVLETAGTVKAWIQLISATNETTIYEINITVEPRTKKNDYIQPEDEQSFREEVQQMIEEAGRPTAEEIDPIVKDYLEKNPPQAYDDTQIKADIRRVEQSIPTVPQNVSAFRNDAGYLTEHQSLEDYAKKSEIPAPYNDSEIRGQISGINTSLSQKQNTLVSGVNIATINGNNLLEGGNITIQGGGSGTTDYSALSNKPKINNVELSGNKTLSQLGINNLSTSDVDSRVQTYWNAHKSELKGDKGDKGDDGTNYTITNADYDAIANVVIGKLPMAESEEF